MNLSDIHIRDPFVLPYDGKYYMYGSDGELAWQCGGVFNCYVSDDLINWTGPNSVFNPGKDFWADRNFWAPEVHVYKGSFYMFASFYSEKHMRAVQILRSESPLGPFEAWSDTITPSDWMCLDGTLYVDNDSVPWMIFCHEWLQIGIGTICAIKLKSDLTASDGKPIKLFSADEADWVQIIQDKRVGKDAAITDGPFIVKAKNGKLVMLWSSLSKTGYALGTAISDNGNILGPWRQESKSLFDDDGGHGMIFKGYDGLNYLSLHRPNGSPNERPAFIKLSDDDSLFNP